MTSRPSNGLADPGQSTRKIGARTTGRITCCLGLCKTSTRAEHARLDGLLEKGHEWRWIQWMRSGDLGPSRWLPHCSRVFPGRQNRSRRCCSTGILIASEHVPQDARGGGSMGQAVPSTNRCGRPRNTRAQGMCTRPRSTLNKSRTPLWWRTFLKCPSWSSKFNFLQKTFAQDKSILCQMACQAKDCGYQASKRFPGTAVDFDCQFSLRPAGPSRQPSKTQHAVCSLGTVCEKTKNTDTPGGRKGDKTATRTGHVHWIGTSTPRWGIDAGDKAILNIDDVAISM